MSDCLVVPTRFRGPAASGNGGWTAGALAARLLGGTPLGQAVRVRLSAPPPLDEPMTLRAGTSAGTAVLDLLAGDVLVASAQVVDDDVTAVPAVPSFVAAAAGERYAGLTDHPFPSCFVCGTGREVGDGLRLQPGPLDPPDDTTACVWDVDAAHDAGDGRADLATVWAAVDCPGGWAVDVVGRPMVLGTMTAVVTALPAVGSRCMVRGQVVARGERTVRTLATLYGDAGGGAGEAGGVLARAAHIWVVVDPRRFTP